MQEAPPPHVLAYTHWPPLWLSGWQKPSWQRLPVPQNTELVQGRWQRPSWQRAPEPHCWSKVQRGAQAPVPLAPASQPRASGLGAAAPPSAREDGVVGLASTGAASRGTQEDRLSQRK